SYGAVLAFQTAQLVFATTGQRPVVVILDMPAPTSASRRSIAEARDAEIVLAIAINRAREIGRQSTADASWLQRNGNRNAVADLLERLRADGVVPPNFTADLAIRLAGGYRRRMQAVER